MLPAVLSLCTGLSFGIFLHRLSCLVDIVPASRAVCQIAGVLSTAWALRNTVLCNLNRQKEKEY